jgi:hypothetical protein
VALPAALVIALAWLRFEHSLAGELVAAIALPGAGAAVAVASGLPVMHAAMIWGAWTIGYACSVVAVHRVIARHRAGPAMIDRILIAACAGTTLAGIALAGWTPIAAVVVPLAASATGLVLHPPRANRLRAVGVALVIASIVSGGIAIVIG